MYLTFVSNATKHGTKSAEWVVEFVTPDGTKNPAPTSDDDEGLRSATPLNSNLLDLLKGDLVVRPVVKLGSAGALVTAVLTEHDIVAMRRAAVLVHKDQLVSAAIEGSHAGVIFDPHAKVLELGVYLRSGRQNFGRMAPVHADKVDRAIEAVAGKQRKDSG